MKKTIGLCLVVIIVAFLLPGCSGGKIKTTEELPQRLEELSLTEMWNAVVVAADVQETTAELDSLRIHTDGNGAIDSLSFAFQGRNKKGVPCIYFADMGQAGKIDIREYEGEPESVSAHPMRIFAEIDKYGLASLEPGEAGLSVEIGFLQGDIGYSYDYSDIYHLEDGILRQLEEIVFHSEIPWCYIGVYKLTPLETVVAEDGRSVAQAATAAGPVPTGERASQLWFLNEGINKAEVVEYLED